MGHRRLNTIPVSRIFSRKASQWERGKHPRVLTGHRGSWLCPFAWVRTHTMVPRDYAINTNVCGVVSRWGRLRDWHPEWEEEGWRGQQQRLTDGRNGGKAGGGLGSDLPPNASRPVPRPSQTLRLCFGSGSGLNLFIKFITIIKKS